MKSVTLIDNVLFPLRPDWISEYLYKTWTSQIEKQFKQNPRKVWGYGGWGVKALHHLGYNCPTLLDCSVLAGMNAYTQRRLLMHSIDTVEKCIDDFNTYSKLGDPECSVRSVMEPVLENENDDYIMNLDDQYSNDVFFEFYTAITLVSFISFCLDYKPYYTIDVEQVNDVPQMTITYKNKKTVGLKQIYSQL